MALVTLCLIALAAAGLFITLNRKTTDSDLTPTDRIPAKSIAVLPFETLSESKDDSYFADGVQDEINFAGAVARSRTGLCCLSS